MTKDTSHDADFGDDSLDDTALDDTAEYPYEPVAAERSPAPALPWQRVPHDPTRRTRSFLRTHRLSAGIAAAVLGVILVSGGTAWAVSAGVAGGLATRAAVSTAATSPAVPAAGSPVAGSRAAGSRAAGLTGRAAARGTITAMTGSTWTITTAAGKTLTVTITTATRFGTPKAPAAASDFSVGSTIVVLGHRSASDLTAARVAAGRAGGRGPTGTGGTTS